MDAGSEREARPARAATARRGPCACAARAVRRRRGSSSAGSARPRRRASGSREAQARQGLKRRCGRARRPGSSPATRRRRPASRGRRAARAAARAAARRRSPRPPCARRARAGPRSRCPAARGATSSSAAGRSNARSCSSWVRSDARASGARPQSDCTRAAAELYDASRASSRTIASSFELRGGGVGLAASAVAGGGSSSRRRFGGLRAPRGHRERQHGQQQRERGGDEPVAPVQRTARALALDLLRRLTHQPRRDAARVVHVAGEQRAVADQVHEPRDPARQAVHGDERVVVEADLALAVGDQQAVPDVGLGLLERERRQVIAGGHTLRELAQLVAPQQLAQLRLAHQHDLDQLLGVGLEVRDQAHLLQHLGREVLRLVDQQHHVALGGARLEQEAVQRVDQALLAARPRVSRAGRRAPSAAAPRR